MSADSDARLVQRQALAGMLWTKQLYLYDVRRWLDGDPGQPAPPAGRTRNRDWRHLNNADIISMPDKWEYPWYAAWDLAFHCVTFALIDPEFAKDQLVLMLREWYMHPNGQLPAYEWAFGDVNPAGPCLGGVARLRDGPRPDRRGRPCVPGAGVSQASAELHLVGEPARTPTGATCSRAGSWGWTISACSTDRPRCHRRQHGPGGRHRLDGDVHAEPAAHRAGAGADQPDLPGHRHQVLRAFPVYRRGDDRPGGKGIGLWDEQDGFFYDALRLPGGRVEKMRVRSLVGLIPMLAVEVLDASVTDHLPEFAGRLRWFLRERPDLAKLISRWSEPGQSERGLLSLLRGHR